jgi:hypothetical protein
MEEKNNKHHIPHFSPSLGQKVLGILGNLCFLYPSMFAKVTLVTGKKGKTATIHLLRDFHLRVKRPFAYISSEEMGICLKGEMVSLRTHRYENLNAFTIQQFIRKALKYGATHIVLEASYEHISFGTFQGVEWDQGLVTYFSLREEPLEEEHTLYGLLREHLLDKLAFTRRKNGIAKTLFLNRDDYFFTDCEEVVADKKYAFGGTAKATVHISQVRSTKYGMRAELMVPNRSYPLKTNMLDELHIYFLLAAFTFALAEHMPLEELAGDLVVPKEHEFPLPIPVSLGLTLADQGALLDAKKRSGGKGLVVAIGAECTEELVNHLMPYLEEETLTFLLLFAQVEQEAVRKLMLAEKKATVLWYENWHLAMEYIETLLDDQEWSIVFADQPRTIAKRVREG